MGVAAVRRPFSCLFSQFVVKSACHFVSIGGVFVNRHVGCLIFFWFLTVLFGFCVLLYNPDNLDSSNNSGLSAQAVSRSIDVPVNFDFDDKFVTKSEAASHFSDRFSFQFSEFADDFDYLKISDFFHMLSVSGKYIIENQDGFLYLLGDSSFMTQSEFDELNSDLSRDMPREEFEHYMNHIATCDLFLSNSRQIQSVKEYDDLLWGYYREFWDLYNANSDSGRYWLQDIFSGGLDSSRLFSVLHETAHEESARRSYGYAHRSCSNHDWQVVWFDNISTMHPYNLKTGEFQRINIVSLPDTRDVLVFKHIPSCVKDTVWFDTYVWRYDAISNLFSIYGMTEEFCANMIDVKCAAISDIIGYDGKVLSDDDLRPYYFWCSLLCEYLLSLKEYDYTVYNAVLQDEVLMNLIRDVYSSITNYVDLIGVAYSNTWDSVALKSWYESSRIQMALSEYFVI